MSLVRLLTSGKSLVGLKDSESHYRLLRKSMLPKFGPPRNPFLARSDADKPASETGAPPPKAGELSPAERAAANLKKTKRLPVMTPPGEEKKGFNPWPSREMLHRISGFVRKCNPLRRWTGRHPVTKPAGPGLHRPTFQAELSLDHIQVVRNDLSEADVEIVPARVTAKTKAGRATPDQGQTEWGATQPG